MASDEAIKKQVEILEAAVAFERKAIDKAPKVPLVKYQPMSSGMAGRCNWCGRVSADLVLVDVFHGAARYKGKDCCGQRHDR